jgi:hypothetical protein
MTTFREHYQSIPSKKAVTPKQKFIDDICEATKKCEKTVRCWIAETQKPDALARSIISERLKISTKELFPCENYTYVRRQTPATE